MAEERPLLSPEDLARFEANAEAWSHPTTGREVFEDWALHRSKIYIQILDKVAVESKSASTMLAAIRDCREQVMTLVELLEELRVGRKRK
jgi:hypothetical protein